VLSISVSISEMLESLKKSESSGGERLVAIAKVAKDTFQIVDASSAAIHATFGYLRRTEPKFFTKFAELGEKVKGPGLVLEAVLNVQEGSQIILLGEDSLAAAALRSDDSVDGWLEESRGLVLVASAVPGAVAASATLIAGGTAAAAMAAAIPPLGLALAIAGVIVVGLNIALYIHHGPANIMDELKKALDKAKVREFGDFFDEDRTKNSVRNYARTLQVLITRNS
jgi:hypothetical protein